MLCLTRKVNESVIINCNGTLIKVTVCKDRGNNLLLGFDAPPSVQVDREEIYISKQRGSVVNG